MNHEEDVSGVPPKPNRRNKLRFPLNSEVRYRIIRRGQGKLIEGQGIVKDISSKGIAFSTETPPRLEAHVSLSLPWPVLLNPRCQLRFLAEGSVVRVEGNLVVASIESYEFRTSGLAAGPAAGEIAGTIRGAEELLRAGL